MAGWRPTPGTGKWWLLGIAFALAFTTWASWRVLSVADQAMDVTTTGFQVLDDRTMTVTFQITKPPEVTAICTIQAQDLRKNVVGSTTITVPAGTARVSDQTATVRTTTQAFAGLVHDCVRG